MGNSTELSGDPPTTRLHARMPGLSLACCDRLVEEEFRRTPAVFYRLAAKSHGMYVTEFVVMVMNRFNCDLARTAKHLHLTERSVTRIIEATGIVIEKVNP